MKVCHYRLLLFIIFLFPIFIFGQNSRKNRRTENAWDRQLIDAYFHKFPPKTKDDSVFFEAYNYLTTGIARDTANMHFGDLVSFVEQNKPASALKELHRFYDSVWVENQRYHNQLAKARELRRLKAIADTADVSSVDSLFDEITGAIIEPTINFDSILSIEPRCSDTLVKAVRFALINAANDPYLRMIQELRKDTVDLYFVNFEGDSILLRLYKNSPEMTHIYLTDMLGKRVKTLVRDVQKNSLRLIIDETTGMEIPQEDQAKKAIGGMYQGRPERKLTLSKRNNPGNTQPWSWWGNTGLDLSQIGYKDWIKSGIKGNNTSWSFLASLDLFANYKKGIHSWENTGRFRYGATRYDDSIYRPIDDKIEILSKYGFKAFGKFSYSTILEFKTQFATAPENNIMGHKPISDFFSPAYLTFAAGLDYQLDQKLSVLISPLTSKTTFVTNPQVSRSKYGVEEGKNYRTETGAILNIKYFTKIFEDIEIENRVELFSSYVDNPQNVDVYWYMRTLFPVNDYIRAILSTELMYDDNQNIPKLVDKQNNVWKDTKAIQFKEIMTIGFAMKF